MFISIHHNPTFQILLIIKFWTITIDGVNFAMHKRNNTEPQSPIIGGGGEAEVLTESCINDLLALSVETAKRTRRARSCNL